MNRQTIEHGTFKLENNYQAPPDRVYDKWADARKKAAWFVEPENWTLIKRGMDFRVGGVEFLQGRFNGEMKTVYSARLHNIIASERIVYVYDMYINGIHHSISLATVEFVTQGSGMRMVYNEQIVFMDGTSGAEGALSRENGIAARFKRLE